MAGRSLGRTSYLALAILTIALGTWVYRGGTLLGPVARDVLGDALWAAMMAWWVGAVTPRSSLLTRSTIALGICLGVELSQLLHTPAIDAVRRTTLGHLVLGSGFDPRDLAAYALGVVVAALLEWSALARRAHPHAAI